mgnify:FL=1
MSQFKKLFHVTPKDNCINILTHAGRSEITNRTVDWWHSHGWQTQVWDNTGNLPAVGRNRILKKWKRTDSKMLLMCDDDITLYTHRYLTEQFLRQPPDCAVYTLNSNQQVHHQHLNSTGWDLGNHVWTPTDQITKFYVIASKQVPLQDETLCALEDMDWAWQCAQLGIKPYRLETVFLKEHQMHTHSLFGNQSSRKELYSRAEKQLQNKWCYSSRTAFRKQLNIRKD